MNKSMNKSKYFVLFPGLIDLSPFTFLSPPFTRYERDFCGQALSLYNCYLERGLPVTLQLWSTQDGGQHFKISCPPIQHLRPPTQPISQHKPVNHKTPCRRRRDLKRMEQGRRAQGVGNQVNGAGDQVEGAGDQVEGAGDQVEGAEDQVHGAGEQVQGAGDQFQGAGDQVQGAGGKFKELHN